jgi:pyruvate/2-oxoglutarate dehydrogenase complex dihydrolipoamide acyltransferase (E2) component
MAQTPITVPLEWSQDGEVELTDWLADAGALVTAGQPVAEVVSSKAALELGAPATGILRRLAAVGQHVADGEAIAVVEHE